VAPDPYPYFKDLQYSISLKKLKYLHDFMFELIIRKFHSKFKDGADADKIVAEILKDRVVKGKLDQCIVLGILRGGVMTAGTVFLQLLLDG
jgi:hypothetical protein